MTKHQIRLAWKKNIAGTNTLAYFDEEKKFYDVDPRSVKPDRVLVEKIEELESKVRLDFKEKESLRTTIEILKDQVSMLKKNFFFYK